MRLILTYIKLEFKCFIKIIPHILIGTTALSLIAGLVALSAKNIFSSNSSSDNKVKVALVVEDSSSLMTMLTDMLKNSDCISASCELIETDYDTAYHMVSNNDVTAAILIPKDFVKSIQNGSNHPINVRFSDKSTIMALILKQLSLAGAGTLSAAQAGIYAQYDIYKTYGFMSYDNEANRYLNDIYLKYVLKRNTIFHKTPVLPTGNITITEYYKSAGIALILLMISISCSTFLCGSEPAFEKLCSSKGINYPIRFFAKLLVLSTFCTILIYIMLNSITQTAIIIPAIICSNCIAIFIYRMCSSTSIGIFAVFTFNFISAFLSGYFVPASFFPNAIKNLSLFLPAALILKQIQYTINGGIAATLALLLISFCAFAGACITDHLKNKGGNLN